MSDLAAKECVPCKGGVPALEGSAIRSLLAQLKSWEAINEHHLHKSYSFPNFVTSLAFVNRIGELAEKQQHHPDILLAWGKVEVTIWTHKVEGLTESDFVLAAKIDQLPRDV